MRPVLVIVSLVIASAVAFFVLTSSPKEDVTLYIPPKAVTLPSYGVAPQFSLTDSNATTFESKQLEGKVWVADFFFSSCGGPCPLMAGNMQTLQEHFKDRNDVRLVNFSVDPETDTPEVLKQYAGKLKADTSRWHFLTGPEQEIMRLSVDGFKVGNGDNIMNHSPKFMLVDQQGLIRGYYTGTDPEDTAELIKDIEKL